MTIVEFLRQRLGEDQEVAEKATRPPWRSSKAYPNLAEGEPGADEPCHYSVDCRPAQLVPVDSEPGFEIVDADGWGDHVGAWGTVADWSDDQPNFRDASADADHIARHDPARVLAQVAALRAIVDRYEHLSTAFGCDPGEIDVALGAVHDLAAIWREHPEFDPAWAVE